MQVLALSTPRTFLEAHLLHLHYQLRARVFADRLGWEVDVTAGCESDGFDALRPTYVLAIADSGQLAGCARLLPALGPTMVADVFPSLLPDGQLNGHAAMIESSRFCVDTALAEGRGTGSVHDATLTMFAGIVEWSMANGYTGACRKLPQRPRLSPEGCYFHVLLTFVSPKRRATKSF
ncbi:N-acyl-L-homoserine lactone synthetase [Rhizobium ruizarguesonis]